MNTDVKKELWEVPNAVRMIASQPLPREIVTLIGQGRFAHGLWLGRGTSKLAAMWLSMAFFELSDFRVFHLPFSVARRKPGADLSKTLYFAVSESGSTPEVVDAVKLGQSLGATCYSIVNNKQSELIRISDHATCLEVGPGEGFTFKSFTSTILHAAKFANVIGGGREDLAEMRALGDLADMILAVDPLLGLAEMLVEAKSVFFLSRGMLSPIAGNMALKLRELPLIPAEHKSSEEFLHGYGEAAVREKCLIVVLITDGEMLEAQLKTVRYLASRRANFAVLCPDSLGRIMPKDVRVFRVPTTRSPLLAGVCLTIAFYRALYSLLGMLGTDADDDETVGKIVSPASFIQEIPELQ